MGKGTGSDEAVQIALANWALQKLGEIGMVVSEPYGGGNWENQVIVEGRVGRIYAGNPTS